jgi:hypothetical protein
MVDGWRIIEAPSYERSVQLAGGAEFCDDAISPIIYALHRNPLGFPDAPGVRGLKLAKTKIRVRGRIVFPSMRLWFRVRVIAKEVEKCWIEACPPEGMAYSDGWWNEDD